ncbi:MAG: hypothetical protein SP1CHLAM54_06100 [Chlamydiia bacterium]|nr:hypothetical protein [Chlamydiia bacterium]MCH9615520.1 hypothetical protein [Chlamydiia bacterium]MCH9629175.1 hypothetical protein [Chlamydiia bacterium]
MKQVALEACRKAYRKETGFVHDGVRIPVFENLCFALALCRSKIAANVLEAKTVLERLIPFFNGEGFPRFLHNYPKTSRLPFELPLMYLERDFGHLLKLDLQKLLKVLPEPQPLTFQDTLHPDLLVPVAVNAPQRGYESDLTMDALFCEKTLDDHPLLIQSILIDGGIPTVSEKSALTQNEDGTRLIWGTKDCVHSLFMRDPLEGLFVDLRAEIWIKGEKSTTFQLGDQIEIRTKTGSVFVKFTAKKGRYFGHLSRKNRPTQILKDGFQTYDWCLSLRALEPLPDAPPELELDYQLKAPSHEDHCQHTALHP